MENNDVLGKMPLHSTLHSTISFLEENSDATLSSNGYLAKCVKSDEKLSQSSHDNSSQELSKKMRKSSYDQSPTIVTFIEKKRTPKKENDEMTESFVNTSLVNEQVDHMEILRKLHRPFDVATLKYKISEPSRKHFQSPNEKQDKSTQTLPEEFLVTERDSEAFRRFLHLESESFSYKNSDSSLINNDYNVKHPLFFEEKLTDSKSFLYDKNKIRINDIASIGHVDKEISNATISITAIPKNEEEVSKDSIFQRESKTESKGIQLNLWKRSERRGRPPDAVGDKVWNQRLEELKIFKKKFGHCNVTSSLKYASSFTNAEQQNTLSTWVKGQRQAFRKGALKEERKILLSKAGFDFDRPSFKATSKRRRIDMMQKQLYHLGKLEQSSQSQNQAQQQKSEKLFKTTNNPKDSFGNALFPLNFPIGIEENLNETSMGSLRSVEAKVVETILSK